MKSKLLPEEHVMAALLLVMLAIMGANVATRKIPMGISISFAEELVVYLFVCCSMLGASAACYRGANMGLTAIVELLPRSLQKASVVVTMLASVLLFGFLCKQGWETMWMVIEYEQETPILRIPQWIFTAFYVIGPVMYVVRSFQATCRAFREGGN